MTKYVKRVPQPDGTEYLYLRRKGCPATPLANAWNTPALADEVAALIKAHAPERALPGTLKAAVRDYELRSPEFAVLEVSTKAEYSRYLREFEEAMGDLPLSAFTPKYVRDLRNAWALRGHRAAGVRLQVLKNALDPPIADEVITPDPFARLKAPPKPRGNEEPHLIWSAEAFAAIMARLLAEKRFGIARAVAIGRYAGARRGDLVQIGRGARSGGHFRFLSGKKRVPVDIAEDPELTRWLDATPASQPDEARPGRKQKKGATAPTPATLVYNLRSLPYTEDGLGQVLAAIVEALHLEGAIDSASYNLHGLRHTRGVELALAGCTDAEGAAQLGHASPNSFATYRRQAERIRLAENAHAKVTALRERQPNAGDKQTDKQVTNGGGG